MVLILAKYFFVTIAKIAKTLEFFRTLFGESVFLGPGVFGPRAKRL